MQSKREIETQTNAPALNWRDEIESWENVITKRHEELSREIELINQALSATKTPDYTVLQKIKINLEKQMLATRRLTRDIRKSKTIIKKMGLYDANKILLFLKQNIEGLQHTTKSGLAYKPFEKLTDPANQTLVDNIHHNNEIYLKPLTAYAAQIEQVVDEDTFRKHISEGKLSADEKLLVQAMAERSAIELHDVLHTLSSNVNPLTATMESKRNIISPLIPDAHQKSATLVSQEARDLIYHSENEFHKAWKSGLSALKPLSRSLNELTTPGTNSFIEQMNKVIAEMDATKPKSICKALEGHNQFLKDPNMHLLSLKEALSKQHSECTQILKVIENELAKLASKDPHTPRYKKDKAALLSIQASWHQILVQVESSILIVYEFDREFQLKISKKTAARDQAKIIDAELMDVLTKLDQIQQFRRTGNTFAKQAAQVIRKLTTTNIHPEGVALLMDSLSDILSKQTPTSPILKSINELTAHKDDTQWINEAGIPLVFPETIPKMQTEIKNLLTKLQQQKNTLNKRKLSPEVLKDTQQKTTQLINQLNDLNNTLVILLQSKDPAEVKMLLDQMRTSFPTQSAEEFLVELAQEKMQQLSDELQKITTTPDETFNQLSKNAAAHLVVTDGQEAPIVTEDSQTNRTIETFNMSAFLNDETERVSLQTELSVAYHLAVLSPEMPTLTAREYRALKNTNSNQMKEAANDPTLAKNSKKI